MKLSQLRQEAADHLKENGKSFSKMVFIHSAIAAGISFLLLLINWLTQHIGFGDSICNIDGQILLTTIQVMLQLISILAIPFWSAGLVFCAFKTIQGENYSLLTLTEGFRCWGPICSSLLIQGLNYSLFSMLSSFAASAFLSTIPLSPSLQEAFLTFAEEPVFPPPENVQIFLYVYMAVYLIGLLVLLIPRLYLHRLIPYRIMDGNEVCNGLQAVLYSRILMKGNRRKLLLLDLSFWWYYLLEVCIGAICVGNVILATLGVSLPVGEDIAFWLFPLAALVLRLILHYCAKPKLAITYAVFFRNILSEKLPKPEPPKPKRMPWKY